jgi:MinD-like ATPase involved in chromosome partitioning or flagellar assembly
MNRSSANVGLKTREVEDGLHVKVAHELPLDRTVQVCVNRGESVVLTQPRSEFARAVSGLVNAVTPRTPKPAKTDERKRRLSFARA